MRMQQLCHTSALMAWAWILQLQAALHSPSTATRGAQERCCGITADKAAPGRKAGKHDLLLCVP